MSLVYSIEIIDNDTSKTFNDILEKVFTKQMEINIMVLKKNAIVFLINRFFKLSLNTTKLIKIKKQNARGRDKSNKNTRKNRQFSKCNKTKKSTKSRSKFNKLGGGKIKNLILGVLAFFITDLFVEIQWVHNSLDIIPSNNFHNANVFEYNPNLKQLLENVDTIDLNSNMSPLDIQRQMSMILNSKGNTLSLSKMNMNNINTNKKNNHSHSLNHQLSSEQFRPVFMEIDLSKEGPTSKLIDLMENLPKKIKPYIRLGSDPSGYKVFCEWFINDSNEISIKMYNTSPDKGDQRFRNLPNMKQIDDITKKSFEQQIHIMKQTKLLTKEETHGFGELLLANLFPVSTKSFNSNTDYFHQNTMSLNAYLKNNLLNFASDYPMRKSIIRQKNIKLSRPTIYDSIMTMTYSKDVIDANYRISNNTGIIKNINTSNKSGFTRIYDQSRGIQHSAKRHSRFDTTTTSRNIAIMFIMPNIENNFYKKNYYIER